MKHESDTRNRESIQSLSPDEKRTLLARLLRERLENQASFALSHGQRGLWFLNHLDRAGVACNIHFASAIHSPVDLEGFRKSLQMLLEIHPALRTTFEQRDGTLRQHVHENMPLFLEVYQAEAWSDDELRQRLDREIHRPFDLHSGPLFRTFLFQRGMDEYVFLATSHHLVLDFWSVVILWKDVCTRYAMELKGRSQIVPRTSRATYAEFVKWQAERLRGSHADDLESYWLKSLSSTPHVLEIPLDYPRPAVFSHTAGSVPYEISSYTTQKLLALASQEKVTLFTTLLASLQVVLGRHTGEEEFLIGSPFSGRSHPDFADTVGCFINLLPLRSDLSGNPTVRQLLHRTSKTVWEALSHQDFPFPLMVERMKVDRDLSRHPLVQVAFTLEQSQLGPEAKRGGFLFANGTDRDDSTMLQQEALYLEQRTCQMDLEWVLERAGTGLGGILRFCASLYTRETAERLVQRFQTVLESVVSHPDSPISEIEWFPRSEHRRILEDWNQTNVSFPSNYRLDEFFTQQASRDGEQTALRTPRGVYSYGQLEQAANQVSSKLQELGVQRGSYVGLCFEPCLEMIAAILATLKAGSAYIPLDPQAPQDRLRRIMMDAGLKVVITRADMGSMLPRDVAPVLEVKRIGDQHGICGTMRTRSAEQRAGDVAYVIYTSGSTGQPKGVEVEHRAICNTIFWRQRDLPLDPSDRCLWIVPYYFDPSIAGLFQAFAAGASLVIAESGEERHPPLLLRRMIAEKVTVVTATPKLLELLLQDPNASKCTTIRRVLCGGEAPSPDLPQRIRQVWGAAFVNLYGPTEAAVEATWWTSDEEIERKSIPIGRPIANMRTYVLDAHKRLLPIGVPGEIYLEGPGLARGYLNDLTLTDERFLTGDFPFKAGGRVYRTGDRARWLGCGNLEFLGRVDDQFKLRGYRLEPREIEAAIEADETVKEAAVLLRSTTLGDQSLDALVVLQEGKGRPTSQKLSHALRQRLPGYMVPERIWFVSQLPYSSSGKLDRQRLPELLEQHSGEVPGTRRRTPPRNGLEALLANLWSDLLGIDQLGREDNFYELGGTSLQGALFISRLQKELDEQLPLVTIFELPTVAELARFLAKAFPENIARRFGSEALEDERSLADGEAVMSTVQRHDAQHPPVDSLDLLVPLQPQGDRLPLFLIHPPGGIVACYQALAHSIGPAHPVYGIRGRGLHRHEELPECFEKMAAEYCTVIQSRQSHGPYMIGGWSLGGVIALEVAQQLLAQNAEVALLGLFDTTIPHGVVNQAYNSESETSGVEYGLDLSLEELAALPADRQLPFLWEHVQRLGLVDSSAPSEIILQLLNDLKRVFHHHVRLASEYAVRRYPGKITLFRPEDVPSEVLVRLDRGWGQLAANVEVHLVPGQHHTMVKPPHVERLAYLLTQCMQACDRR